ncbi:hypothetical protein TNCV_4726421 [Trichonephila clavipes]|nr:hypothetical protein TNCV_4726421 [Trichonephila clavipes]
MKRLTNTKLADMHLIPRLAEGNARVAERLYHERHPQGDASNTLMLINLHRIFQSVSQRHICLLGFRKMFHSLLLAMTAQMIVVMLICSHQCACEQRHLAPNEEVTDYVHNAYCGLGSNPGEHMDIKKNLVPLQQEGTLNSNRAASPFVWLVEREERWEVPGHTQSSNVCFLDLEDGQFKPLCSKKKTKFIMDDASPTAFSEVVTH